MNITRGARCAVCTVFTIADRQSFSITLTVNKNNSSYAVFLRSALNENTFTVFTINANIRLLIGCARSKICICCFSTNPESGPRFYNCGSIFFRPASFTGFSCFTSDTSFSNYIYTCATFFNRIPLIE